MAASRGGDKTGIVDVVLSWDPSENLSTWVNFDYVWVDSENAPGDPGAYGVAIAGRLGITENTGFALRGEYVRSIDNFVLGTNIGAAIPPVLLAIFAAWNGYGAWTGLKAVLSVRAQHTPGPTFEA